MNITSVIVFLIVHLEQTIWVTLYLPGLVIYALTMNFGGRRALFTYWGHLSILLAGRLLGGPPGILFISVPLLALYYYIVYRLAEVIIPASDPEDRQERFQRFKILAWYFWGLQFPIFMASEPTSIKVDKLIDGNAFRKITKPGYIWTHLHQVIGLTSGTSFSRVEGPGAIFTNPFERPQEIIDLRTQLRSKEIKAITQDGIPINATVFTSFRIDREEWDRDLYNRLRYANPLLNGAKDLDAGTEPFKYSTSRVRAALGIEGVKSSTTGPDGNSSIRWDEQVLNLIGETARFVISEVPLSELWQPNPKKDGEGVSALNLIADEIFARIAGKLKENGVQLFTARIVDYSLQSDKGDGEVDKITEQQLPAWTARWGQRASKIRTEASAEAEQKIEDASVLARSMFLSAVAEALQENKLSDKDLYRYLIAVRFLSALDETTLHEAGLSAEDDQIKRDYTLLRKVISKTKKRMADGD
ncbi:MAG: hypothetical protein JXA13_03795 [Anaerolineales bacterium]|nr:hypothetical protein [Anaerolineales bacterium]